MNINGDYRSHIYSAMHKAVKNENSTFSIADANGIEPGGVEKPKSCKDILKERYPKITYHVVDSKEISHIDRQDFPINKLFYPNADMNQLKNWQPNGAAPVGYKQGVQRILNSIALGSFAVTIPPDVQAKIAYADKIAKTITAYSNFKIAESEGITPGCTMGVSQFICIGKDGNVDNFSMMGSSSSIVDSESILGLRKGN